MLRCFRFDTGAQSTAMYSTKSRVQTVVSGLPRIISDTYCCDSHGKLVWTELNTFKQWLVRPSIGSFIRLAVLNVSVVAARKATARHMSGSPAAIERQGADDPNRLAGRCRSEQSPPLDSVLTVYLRCRFSCTSRPTAYTRDELIEMEVRILAALELRISTSTGFSISWSLLGRCDAKTAEPRSVPDRTHSHRLFYERHLPSNLAVLGSDLFQLFSSVVRVPSSRQVRSLSQTFYGNGYLGQTETPRREAWSVSSFPGGVVPLHNGRSHLQSGTRVGSGEAGSLSVDWCSWENIRRGIHGARRSTETGSARWFLLPTNTLGATASDLGCVGDCAN